MIPCKFCNNLDIPTYSAVSQSRSLTGYDGISAISSTRPRGLKPFITITLEDILQGAEVMGCETCICLKNALLGAFGALDDIRTVECMGTRAGTLKVEVKTSKMFKVFEFYTRHDSPSIWATIGAGREVSLDSSSEECFELALSWIKDCTENHKECFQASHTTLPTRVINVGSDTKEPFLYVSKKENAKYVTLSHCWGGKMPMITTLSTLEDHQREIRFCDLPKTFQDAIKITRRLGVQYIWIDSLCIIQDSKEDWTLEAARMGSVYRNCLVCIAADGAVNGSGGCFIAGDQRRNLDIARVTCPGSNEIHIRYAPNVMAGHGFAHVGVISSFYESKLDTRGWVLQEQSLAPRTLHYTVAELAWDCATYIRCECTLEPEEVESSAAIMQLRACKRMMQYSTTSVSHSWEEGPRWPNFVALFTERSLTFDSDRLHAMSGIAAVVAGRRGDYLAGLWRDELPLGLLWRTNSKHAKDKLVSRRHKSYYAPSWSWASVTAEVEFISLPGRSHNFKLIPDLEVLDAACTPVGANAYGPVGSGYLKLRGSIAAIVPVSGTGVSPNVQEHTALIPRRFDCDVLEGGKTELVDGESLWALLVAHGERSKPGMSDLEGHHCIVLRRSHIDNSAFERVGCMWAVKDWNNELSQRAELKTINLL